MLAILQRDAPPGQGTTHRPRGQNGPYLVCRPHYYFARNYGADSGLIATMLIIYEISRSDLELSIVRKPFERYSQSGEINTQVADAAAVLAVVSEHVREYPQDHLDGLSVDCGSWWFNLRPSNTEPLLRLNLEAATRDECDAHVAEMLSLITSV